MVDKDLWALVCRNVRNSNQVDMDTMLINGALAQAEAQVVKLIDKYGPETVKACMRRDPGSAANAPPGRRSPRCRTAPTTASRPATGTA